MSSRVDLTDRRLVLRSLAMGAAFFSVPGAFAQQLVPTAAQTEGPFYPDHLPLDTDNDLLIINDAITPAIGAVTMLSGRILDASGQPVRNALVEIWQVDNNGVYIHSGSNNRKKHDTNFQGFGRFLTGSKRRVPVPDGEARAVSRAHAAHPLRRQDEGPREVHHAVLHQGRAAERDATRSCAI